MSVVKTGSVHSVRKGQVKIMEWRKIKEMNSIKGEDVQMNEEMDKESLRNMNKFVRFMAEMMDKYGEDVLKNLSKEESEREKCSVCVDAIFMEQLGIWHESTLYFSGIHILTTVPPSSLKEKDMVPPHIMESRSRMLPMAIWGSLLSWVTLLFPSKPGPLSITMISLPLTVSFVSTDIYRGSDSGSTPYLMEFSMMGCKVRGGMRKFVCGVSNSTNNPSSNRTCSMARYARTCSNSSLNGIVPFFAMAEKFFLR